MHPITAVVGGFTNEISRDEYLALAEKMEAMLPFAEQTVDLFNSFPVPDIETAGDMLAMAQDGYYPVCDLARRAVRGRGGRPSTPTTTRLVSRNTPCRIPARSSRVRALVPNTPYMTASLARINASWGQLGQRARLAAAKAGLRPPERNPFRNNVAQAVELVDALDRCAAHSAKARRGRQLLRGFKRACALHSVRRSRDRASPRLRAARSSTTWSSTRKAA